MIYSKPIVFIAEYYPPFGAGGAEVSLPIHTQILAENGNTVWVITPNYETDRLDEYFENNVKIIRVPLGLKLPPNGKQLKWNAFLSKSFQDRFKASILNVIGDTQVALLQSNNSASFVSAHLASQILGVPHIAYVRDTANLCAHGAKCLISGKNNTVPSECGLIKNTLCNFTENTGTLVGKTKNLPSTLTTYQDIQRRQTALRFSKKIAFNSKNTLDLHCSTQAFSDFRSKANILFEPYRNIDTTKHEPESTPELRNVMEQLRAQNAKILLYVGKLSVGKGTQVLFNAHQEVLKKHPNTHLVLAGNCGPNPEKTWTFDKSKAHLLGFVAQKYVGYLYSQCNIAVAAPSWPEPFGRSNVDAGLYSKPVVSTRVGGIPEVIEHEKTGLLVDRLNPAAFSEAVCHVLENPDLEQSMGKAAKIHVENKFGAAAIYKQFCDLYSN